MENISIFSKIYTYRQRENRNSRENFLTEIFAYCLQCDELFFNNFLKKLKLIDGDVENYSVKTQMTYPQGRPDMEIVWEGNHLLIEAKVDSVEGGNQLGSYLKILENSNKGRKHLVYLTRDYENKQLGKPLFGWTKFTRNEGNGLIESKRGNSLLTFQHFRWMNVYQLIPNEGNLLTQQLKQYLKDQNMHDSNFNYRDITALLEINSTLSKMDRILDDLVPVFKNKLYSGFSKGRARLTDGDTYGDYQWFNAIFNISYGIGWFLGDEIFVFLAFCMKYENENVTKELVSKIKNNLKESGFLFDNLYDCGIGYKKPLTEFFKEEDHHAAICGYLRDCIDKAVELKESHPDIFRG